MARLPTQDEQARLQPPITPPVQKPEPSPRDTKPPQPERQPIAEQSSATSELQQDLQRLKELKSKATVIERRQAIARALGLIDRAMEADACEIASEAARLALAEAGRVGDKELTAQIHERAREAQEAQKAFVDVKAALETLKQQPDDPGANLVAGRYYALIRGNWYKGLLQLAKGSDERLKGPSGAGPEMPPQRDRAGAAC